MTQQRGTKEPASGRGDRPADRVRAAGDEAENATAKVQDKVDEVTEKAQEVPDRAREMAMNAADSGRESTATALENVAERIGERVDGTGGMQNVAAEKAAEGVQEAAGYLREHDAAEIWEDVEGYVKQRPGRAVLVAAATGLIVGRILR